ncbi:MAG: hypothetical protein JSW16_00025 [Dehalococcoidales bacterium]|nr:MAG: hypothetical protein JSW16_00025 [Dehalococcoidales bacterium]
MALQRAVPPVGESRKVKQLLSVLILAAVLSSLAIGGTFADWLEDDHGEYCFSAGEWEVCENEQGSRGWWSQLQSEETGAGPINSGFVTEAQVIGWLNDDISQDSCWLTPTVLNAVSGPPITLDDAVEVLAVGGKDAEGKFYAHYLALWLNLMSGRQCPDTLHDVSEVGETLDYEDYGDGNFLALSDPENVSRAEFVAAVEALCNSPVSDTEFTLMKEISEAFNDMDI